MNQKIRHDNKFTLWLWCILDIEAFNTIWAYYSQSEGLLHVEPMYEAVSRLTQSYRAVIELDPTIGEFENYSQQFAGSCEEFLAGFDSWLGDRTKWPFNNLVFSRIRLWSHLSHVKVKLLKLVMPDYEPQLAIGIEELRHRGNAVRWLAHFGTVGDSIHEDPSAFLEKASRAITIAVVGDIRNSQDLMTYALSADDFASRMVDYLEKVYILVKQHRGIFDKFTGDGFICYFTSASDPEKDQLVFSRASEFKSDLQRLNIETFPAWTSTIRKVPPGGFGLAVGMDVGQVEYRDSSGHFIAVGDAIVWANRMSAAAGPGECICNNRLAHILQRLTGSSLTPVLGKTKAGEEFSAYRWEDDSAEARIMVQEG